MCKEPNQNNIITVFALVLRYLRAPSLEALQSPTVAKVLSALTIAASLNLSTAAQTERTSMPRFIRVSIDLAVPKNVLHSSLGIDNLSTSLRLNNTEKKLEVCKKESKNAKNEKKSL